MQLPTLADSGYEGTGQGIRTPVKQPTDGRRLAIDNRAYNTLLRSLRCLGERGFAILTGRWHSLRNTTASPRNLGNIVRAALVLTQFEYRNPPNLVEMTSVAKYGRSRGSPRAKSKLAVRFITASFLPSTGVGDEVIGVADELVEASGRRI